MSSLKRFWHSLLDRSIYFSFDRSGYLRHKERFQPIEASRLNAKTVLITGGNSGIGFAAAKQFAKAGAQVHLLCRSEERGLEAKKKLLEETGNPEVHLHLADLSDLKAVREFAENSALPFFDLLILNAGAMPLERKLSKQNREVIFAAQVFGHFLLTTTLMERNKISKGSRVIFVSSGGMYLQKLDLQDLNWEKRKYDRYRAYANAKRAQVILTRLFAEKNAGRGIFFAAMHPGWADTKGVDHSMPGFYRWMKSRLRTPKEGADTILWLASTSCEIPSGRFWFDREEVSAHLLSSTKETAEEREALWQLCQSECG